MLLAGVMLIALLTSGKAAATDYNVTLANADGCGLTVSPATTDGSTKEFTLTVTSSSTHKLPTANVTVSLGGNPLTPGDATDGFSYSADNGTITIGSGVTINGAIEITAEAVALSSDATLSALTYSINSGNPVSITVKDNIDDISLDYDKTLEGKSIELVGTTTDPNAEITVNAGATITSGTATATVTVTAEDKTTKDYSVTFNVANDVLATIVAPAAITEGLVFSEAVASSEAALAILNANPYNVFAATTVGEQDGITFTATWTYTDGNFQATAGASNDYTWTIDGSALTEKKLDNTDPPVALTGTASVTNYTPSADATLATLTYKIGNVDPIAVDGFAATDEETSQTYNVTLSASTAKDATITVEATATSDKATISQISTATLSEDKATVTFTVTPESGKNARTITINFTRTKSEDISLSALTYKIGDGGDATTVDGFDPATNEDTYNIVLPVKTSATAKIIIAATPTNDDTKVTGTTEVTLVDGAGKTELTVTAENTEVTRTITINISIAPVQVTAVTVPSKFTLAEETEGNTSTKAIAQLANITGVTITTNDDEATGTKLNWEYLDADNGGKAYAVGHSAKNNFRWTVQKADGSEITGIEGVAVTGLTEVTNFVKDITGDQSSTNVVVKNEDPYTQIGDGTADTKVQSVTVSATNVEELSFDKVEVGAGVTVTAAIPTIAFNNTKVTGKLDLKASVDQIVLNKVEIEEVVLADKQKTTLALQEGNTIEKITNAGELTLNNAEAVQTLSVETKSGLSNTGAVGAVENNGQFTDNTATIVVVDGAANVAITQLPKSQAITGKNAELSVTATAADGATITYQWQKQNGSSWDKVAGNSTAATLSIAKVSNGTTSYRCEVTSTKEDAKTILYTPAVSVTFKSAGDPTPSDPTPTPSTKTYTVTLKKVTGATFSKGETTKVDEGENFSFTITLDKNYNQSKPVVKVGTTTYEPDAKGVYTIKNITKDITIEVTGIVKNTTTGVEETTEDAVRVWSEGSNLYIHTPQAADVYVVSGAGALVRELKAVPGDQNMQLPAGFYIVRVGTYTAKVIIR